MADQIASLELAKIAVPSILVVIGWAVVHFLQRSAASKQELRKEIRASLDRLKQDLRELRKTCIAYFVACDAQPDTPVAIGVLIDDVRRQSMLLADILMRESDEDKEQIIDALTNLSHFATGGSFETRDRKPLSPYAPELLSIFSYGAKLINRLEDSFAKKYHPG